MDKWQGRKSSYGYDLESLMEVNTPVEPHGYQDYWQQLYSKALMVKPEMVLKKAESVSSEWNVYDIEFASTGEIKIGGWLLVPKAGEVKKGLVVGHGYAGRLQPQYDIPVHETAILFLCARGISRSPHAEIPSQANAHVLHGIENRDSYVLRGCVEDTWTAVSALLEEFPQVAGRVGYMGVSFGGGVGAMALAWDKRVQRAFLKWPSFGHQALRLNSKSIGSANSVQRFEKKFPGVACATLQWFDAAVAAKYINIPIVCVCAAYDPVVNPLGQFAVYHQLSSEQKELLAQQCGHVDYEEQAADELMITQHLQDLFEDL